MGPRSTGSLTCCFCHCNATGPPSFGSDNQLLLWGPNLQLLAGLPRMQHRSSIASPGIGATDEWQRAAGPQSPLPASAVSTLPAGPGIRAKSLREASEREHGLWEMPAAAAAGGDGDALWRAGVHSQSGGITLVCRSRPGGPIRLARSVQPPSPHRRAPGRPLPRRRPPLRSIARLDLPNQIAAAIELGSSQAPAALQWGPSGRPNLQGRAGLQVWYARCAIPLSNMRARCPAAALCCARRVAIAGNRCQAHVLMPVNPGARDAADFHFTDSSRTISADWITCT